VTTYFVEFVCIEADERRREAERRARAIRRLEGLLKEAVRSRGLTQPQRFAAAEALAMLREDRVDDALALLQEYIE
jgi:hypothetical protein